MTREKMLKAWVTYCLFVLVSTESLSALHLINRKLLVLIYVMMGITISWKIIRANNVNKVSLAKYWKWYVAITVIIALPLLCLAIYYPPITWDSLTYHLPRVEHWIQASSVSFYTTNNSRQLFMSPLAEYIILHWRLLVGEDYLVNLVQYISMIMSAICATMVVKEKKGSKLIELLSFVLVMTIPMGIMQSTSTQNDYVAAFWLISTIYFMVKGENLWLAAVVGLGVATKSTFMIYSLPWGAYWLYSLWKRKGLRIWKTLMVMILIIVVINGPQWSRNESWFGSIFGPKDMSTEMFNRSLSWKYVSSNMVRSIGSQIGLPNKSYNNLVDRAVNKWHRLIGIPTNDYVNSWYSEKYSTQFSIIDGTTGNLLLLVIFAILSPIAWRKRRSWLGISYLLSFLGWVLFNLLLKWQPWQSRLELPFFVSICPLVALLLATVMRKKWQIQVLMGLLVISSVPFVLGYLPFDKTINKGLVVSDRPLVSEMWTSNKSRCEIFLSQSTINAAYHELVERISRLEVKKIYLDISSNGREYPLWQAMRCSQVKFEANYFNRNNGDVLSKDKSGNVKVVVFDYTDSKSSYLKKSADTVDLGEIKYVIIKAD